jgi:outer membrane immunogenic protein
MQIAIAAMIALRLRELHALIRKAILVKKILLTSAALVAMATSAMAADMAPRIYSKAAPPIDPGINWTGFYLGVMGGYGWSDSVRIGGLTATSGDLKGGFGGGTIGYNWQSPGSQFVWGLEVDAAGSDIKYGESGFIGIFPYTADDKIKAFGSITGRLGVTAGAALFYAKGGYAWADNRISASLLGVNYSESKVLSGWTVGGGVEYMFTRNWSAKAEYMYADYGTENYLNAFAPGGVALGATIHSVKGGINYRFN